MPTITYTPEHGVESLLALGQALAQARKLVAFTGAGVSAESGIATFRGKDDSLWSRYDAHTMATPEAFRANPARVWGWYEYRRAMIANAQPNPGHLAIAELARYLPEVHVITQNVDDLHERAGSLSVTHLHGRLAQARCERCGTGYTHPQARPEPPDTEIDIPPPLCACGGRMRPGVVWFGESLPQGEWQTAAKWIEQCDALLSIGTSSLVYPAAQLPRLAKNRGALVVQINPLATDLDVICDYNLQGPAGIMLPMLLKALQLASKQAGSL